MDNNYEVVETGNNFDVVYDSGNRNSGVDTKSIGVGAAGGAVIAAAAFMALKKLVWDKNTAKQVEALKTDFDKTIQSMKEEQEKQIENFKKLLEDAGLEVVVDKPEEK